MRLSSFFISIVTVLLALSAMAWAEPDPRTIENLLETQQLPESAFEELKMVEVVEPEQVSEPGSAVDRKPAIVGTAVEEVMDSVSVSPAESVLSTDDSR